MSIFEIIRLVLGTASIIVGLMVFIIEIMGIYKQKYVLNRLHAAAMGDTTGIFFMMLGLIFYSGFNFVSAKLLLIIIFFWLTSPVSSHMTALLESYTNDKVTRHLSFDGDLETLEKKLEKEEAENNK